MRTALKGLILDLLLGLFVLGLFLIIWRPAGTGAASPAASGLEGSGPTSAVAKLGASRSRASGLTATQGTPIVATINGSIDGTEPTFIGPRHFRSGILGDRNCRLFGGQGVRSYDEFKFFNNASTTQRILIAFTSGCGFNTYMAAYSPQFEPTNICTNFISSPGLSGTIEWTFTVCANSQFSIVVYALEPGLTCPSYGMTVYAQDAVYLGGPVQAPGNGGIQALESNAAEAIPVMDAVRIRRKHRIPGTDTKEELVIPEGAVGPISGVLPITGTPLVAVVNDSISTTDQTFFGARHFLTGIFGDANCALSFPFGSRFYDEVFFRNPTSTTQHVQVFFTSGCGFGTVSAAYSPQFNPGNICDNFIASSGRSGSANWFFDVCPNSQFSIVVYGINPNVQCAFYSYSVFAPGVALVGTSSDLSITKTGPAGPLPAGAAITYNITFLNSGPRPAQGVVFTDQLPPGTSFVSLNLLTNFGTALPPMCTVPPIGSGGTVECSLNLLGVSGTTLFNPVTYALTVQASTAAGPSITNTALVSHQGHDPNPGNNSSSVTTTLFTNFNLCLQDDSNRSVLQLNSITGDYFFSNCQGVSISGRGRVTVKGAIVTLQDFSGDRRVLASFDGTIRKGSAVLQLFSPTRTFTITDRNTSDNTCSCS